MFWEASVYRASTTWPLISVLVHTALPSEEALFLYLLFYFSLQRSVFQGSVPVVFPEGSPCCKKSLHPASHRHSYLILLGIKAICIHQMILRKKKNITEFCLPLGPAPDIGITVININLPTDAINYFCPKTPSGFLLVCF